MPPESSSDVKFEIGTCLFIDIVDYSKLLINQQSEQMQTLREIVRGTEQFRTAEAKANCCAYRPAMVARLCSAPAPKRRSAARWKSARSSRSIPNLRVRMGIHSGAVSEITDVERTARTSQVPASTWRSE